MVHPGQHLPLSSPVALRFIGDDHPRDVRRAFAQLTEEFLGGFLVALALHQDVEDVAVLIDRPPEVMPLSTHRAKHLVEVPRVTRSGAPATPLICVRLAKFATPLADRFVRHTDAAGTQQFFDIPVAEAKPVVQSHAMTDDLGWEAVSLRAVRWGRYVHTTSMSHLKELNKLTMPI
jgi:hypothetical protein